MHSLIEYSTPVTPNELMLHALFASLTNNALHTLKTDGYRQPLYKVWDEGTRIFVAIDESNTELFGRLSCQDFTFVHGGDSVVLTFEGKTAISPYPLEQGETVEVMGALNYARNVQGKHRCPVGMDGRFVSTDEEVKFREYFERNTGIRANEIATHLVPQNRLPSSTSLSNKNRIDLNNVFALQASGVVVDDSKATLLQVTSIGKKRSYGFGSLFVQSTF